MVPRKINDLRFLDGQGEEADLLQGLELPVLDQAVQLGDYATSSGLQVPLPQQRYHQPLGGFLEKKLEAAGWLQGK